MPRTIPALTVGNKSSLRRNKPGFLGTAIVSKKTSDPFRIHIMIAPIINLLLAAIIAYVAFSAAGLPT